MKIISVFLVLCLLVSTTCAHLCHFKFLSHFSRNCANNEDLKSQCERKVGILSDTVSFIATKKAVLLPALGLGLYSGMTAAALVEKANWFATSSFLSQVCSKFDDGEEHTIDELDYIELNGHRINYLTHDYEKIKSALTQQKQDLKVEVAEFLTSEQFQSQLKAMVAAEVEVKLAEAKNSATFASTSCSCSPHIEETPEFLENSQFTKISVQSDGEKSLESQSKIILKSSQTYPRMNGLHKRPRSRQSPLASKHQLASLRPNMEHFRFSRSVPRKSRKIFSKPPKFPRKKPSPRLLKEKTFSNYNIREGERLVQKDND